MKQKIAFAMIMGTITTGIISYALISINLGPAHLHLRIWIKSWSISYLIVIPAILLISPLVDKIVQRLFPIKNKI